MYVRCVGAVTGPLLSLTARVDGTDLGALTCCVRGYGCEETPMDTGQTVRSGGLEGLNSAYGRMALVRALFGEYLLALLGGVLPRQR
jgi:hypothetical protein